jgi:hypothetical protein
MLKFLALNFEMPIMQSTGSTLDVVESLARIAVIFYSADLLAGMLRDLG